ncbi:MAG: hypothetical protein WC587_00225 [Candidatus Paceibacterota bacterium]
MISIALHFIIAIIFLVSSVVLYILWKKQGSPKNYIMDYFFFLSFFSLYHLALSLPYIIFGENLTLMAWGYILAMISLLFLFPRVYKITLKIWGVSEQKIKLVIYLTTLLILTTIIIYIYDFRTPYIVNPGFIIWNGNIIGSIIIFLLGLEAGVFWAITFLKNIPKDLIFIYKLKTYLYIAAAVLVAISSIYFVSRTVLLVIIAFVSHGLASVFFVIPVLLPKPSQENINE